MISSLEYRMHKRIDEWLGMYDLVLEDFSIDVHPNFTHVKLWGVPVTGYIIGRDKCTFIDTRDEDIAFMIELRNDDIVIR